MPRAIMMRLANSNEQNDIAKYVNRLDVAIVVNNNVIALNG